jgi:hypothetical protein
MATINRLNQLLTTAKNQVSYVNVQAAADQLAATYLQNALTKIGLVNGEDLLGFVSITQATDYTAEAVVLGDSIAVFKGGSLLSNVIIDPAIQQFSDPTSFYYELQYDAVDGCDPLYSIFNEVMSLAAAIAINTGGRVPAPMNPNRIVVTGSMPSIAHTMEGLRNHVGPWTGLAEFNAKMGAASQIGALIPAVQVSRDDITSHQQQLSPILGES